MTTHPIYQWIPQRAPFLLINAVEEVDDSHTVTTFPVRSDCPLVDNGILPLSGLMENAAQTCAVRAGWTQKQHGETIKKGYIGAVKKMEVTRFPKVGETLCTEATLLEEVANISLIECTTRINQEVIATTTLKLATVDE